MYAPQGLPAVYFSVLASSVIIVAAGSCLLPPCVVPALGLLFRYPAIYYATLWRDIPYRMHIPCWLSSPLKYAFTASNFNSALYFLFLLLDIKTPIV